MGTIRTNNGPALLHPSPCYGHSKKKKLWPCLRRCVVGLRQCGAAQMASQKYQPCAGSAAQSSIPLGSPGNAP